MADNKKKRKRKEKAWLIPSPMHTYGKSKNGCFARTVMKGK